MAVNSTSNTTSSTSSYSYLQYKNKISGLVSGMDIDSIMEKLMKAESTQMEKLQQQKQKYEWQRDAYRDVNLSLNTFKTDLFDKYNLTSSWSTKTVNSSSSLVSAVASSSASGTLSISEAQMATAGQKVVSMNNTTLNSLGLTSINGKVKYTVNNVEKTLTYSKDDSVESLMKKMNDTGDFNASFKTDASGVQTLTVTTKNAVKFIDETGTYSKTFANKLGMTLDTNGKVSASTTFSKQVATNAINASSTISSLGLSDGEFKIKAINEQGAYTEKTITYKATDKVSDIMSRINSSGVGVTAIVSGENLSITANSVGAGSDGAINITADNNGLFNKLGVLSGQTGSVTSGKGAVEGTSGYIVANGVKIDGNSNKYTVSGYQITLNNNISSSDTPTTITSTQDVKASVDKVKDFVNMYNSLIESLNSKTSEKKNVDYSPLTDAQKAEMTTEQIKNWEDKAKSGLIRNDTSINSLLSKMRTILNSGTGKDTLYNMGITTSSTWTDNGKLEINEDKLKATIEKDPDALGRIFSGNTDKAGIISQLRTATTAAITNLEQTAGKSSSVENQYALGRNLISIDEKIENWKDRLKDIEARYWSQFSAMETAIQKANNQSSIFSS